MNPNTNAFAEDELDGLINKVTLISELLRARAADNSGEVLNRLDFVRGELTKIRAGVREAATPRPRASESRLRLVKTVTASGTSLRPAGSGHPPKRRVG